MNKNDIKIAVAALSGIGGYKFIDRITKVFRPKHPGLIGEAGIFILKVNVGLINAGASLQIIDKVEEGIKKVKEEVSKEKDEKDKDQEDDYIEEE